MVRDMTTGKPVPIILSFFVPLLFGYLFQQLYNMVDTVIVGQFVGTDAFAAVGAVGALSFLILGFVNGTTSGLSIVVAQYFGSGDYDRVRQMTYNAAYVVLAIIAVVTAGTMLLTGDMLRLMQTPESLFAYSYDYIIVIFGGSISLALYNFPAGIMRALGDSKTPLYFLGMSSVLNIGLDLLFILGFGLGVKGAAWATVISQSCSGVWCCYYLIKHYPVLYAKSRSEFRPNRALIVKGLKSGLPMGLQFSLTAVGSVVLQSAVNTLGPVSVAAVTACNKMGNLLMCPMNTLGLTMATYNGQNIGARRIDRINQGMRQALYLLLGYAVIVGVAQYFFGAKMALMFLHAEETEILSQVARFMRISGVLYPFLGMVLYYRNALQGIGYSMTAMFAGVLELAARAAVAMLVGAYGYQAVCFANPAAWIMADLLLVPAFYLCLGRKRRAFKNT